MSRISNPSAPIDAPAVLSEGEILAPFRRENLRESTHPALRGGNAGGDVAHPSRTVIDGAGGRLNRR
jgi:hypothetical protein